MLSKERPRLVGMMPGSLLYRVEPFAASRTEPDATRQVRCLAVTHAVELDAPRERDTDRRSARRDIGLQLSTAEAGRQLFQNQRLQKMLASFQEDGKAPGFSCFYCPRYYLFFITR